MQKYLYVILKEKKYDQQKNNKGQKMLAKMGRGRSLSNPEI